MNKCLITRTFTCAIALLLSGNTMADDREERFRQSQKTEAWEPEPVAVRAPENAPPSDAIVLLEKDLSRWESVDGGEAKWKLDSGVLTVAPGTGDIRTKENFCDLQLHVEWRTPQDRKELEGQQRNNSGVFLQERYEVQVLDSYGNDTYTNGMAGSIYKQYIPLVNPARPPGEWQTYDIIFNAPRFDEDGKLRKPANITLLFNGVLVQNHVEIEGNTVWIGEPEYEAHGCAPIRLQDHGNPVSFRNIWARKLEPNPE